MKFSDTELGILKNFAGINPSMVIYPDRLEVINNTKTIVGKYKFDNPYGFDSFGIYEVTELLQAVGAFKDADIDVQTKRLVIKDGGAKITYYTTPSELCPNVPDIDKKFATVDCELDFSLPAEKLATIFKMASVLKAEFVFFETDEKDNGIRITVAKEKDSTANAFDIVIREGIRSNTLGKGVIKMAVSELKILPGDYDVKISSKKITKWGSYTGVEYYIGCNVI